MMETYTYDAFISYSHHDMKQARWLQRRLESFHIPRTAEKERPGNGKMRIFRDQTDLAGAELQTTLEKEMQDSRYLIVLCSPASATSRWVNEEITYFCSLGRQSRIIPFIIDGEPNSDNEEIECFPPMLRSDTVNEPLGVNIQEIGRNKAFLKLVAILLGMRFNRLADRAKKRRIRTALGIGAVAAAAAVVTGALLLKNAEITRKNRELMYQAYGSAFTSLGTDYQITPEGVELIQLSAEAGNTDAMMLLADCYERGEGTPADAEAAFQWYMRAAEGGDPKGTVAVANCYFNGVGVPQDSNLAFQWDMKAAQAGDSSGMLNIAIFYESGIGVDQDPGKAFEWYQKSAEAGNDLGIYHCARCYQAGIGVEADHVQAFEWTRKLAESGNLFGMYNLAMMYQWSFGTEEDPQQAYLWYRKAADQGFPEAMYWTGWCIENHYGVENEALEWYKKSAEAGYDKAVQEIERIRNSESPAGGDAE